MKSLLVTGSPPGRTSVREVDGVEPCAMRFLVVLYSFAFFVSRLLLFSSALVKSVYFTYDGTMHRLNQNERSKQCCSAGNGDETSRRSREDTDEHRDEVASTNQPTTTLDSSDQPTSTATKSREAINRRLLLTRSVETYLGRSKNIAIVPSKLSVGTLVGGIKLV